VNPDPRSLWKNLPSDATGVFAKPDAAKIYLATPYLSAIAASLRGRSHAHEGKYREDDFGLRYIDTTGWHILISADGAGSAKFSRKGSQLACQTALTEITKRLESPENPLNAAFAKLGTAPEGHDLETLRKLSYNILIPGAYEAFTAIHKQSKESQATPRDFATTFICVITRRFADRWFLASFSVGDGGAGAVLEDGRVLTLTAPDSGDFAGQTVFLTMQQVFEDSEALLARTKAYFCPSFKFLAVMSDGITDPIFQNDAAFASDTGWDKFRHQLEGVIDLKFLAPGMEDALLDWLSFPSPGNHDDRTLLIAVPINAAA
jgi:serine/threonine protein phosphatase PrpC